jgi:hypothetical protein
MIKQINDRQKQMNAEAFENELMGILQEDGPKNLAHFMAQPGIGKQYGFDEKETAAITSTFEGKIASQAATVKSDLLAQQSADRNRMYEVLVSQDLATINEQITKSSLDVDEKILWHSKSKEWSKAIVGETDKFNQTENAVFKEMYGKIARNPNSVGDDELFAKWGDGLSTSDYQKLAKLKEDGQESPLARRTVVNGHSVLDRTASALKSGLAGVGAGKEEIEEVRNIETELLRDKAELDRWAQANPDATDDQVIQKITELNSPRVQAQALGWLERMRRFFRNAAFATAGFRPPGDRETPEVIELEPTIKVITPDGRTGQVPMRNRDKIPPNWTIVE